MSNKINKMKIVDNESNILKEKILTEYPNVISYECTKKIIEQMEKNICKIKIGNEQGTGFFCKIPFPDKIICYQYLLQIIIL